jgi:hypothetical protein
MESKKMKRTVIKFSKPSSSLLFYFSVEIVGDINMRLTAVRSTPVWVEYLKDSGGFSQNENGGLPLEYG